MALEPRTKTEAEDRRASRQVAWSFLLALACLGACAPTPVQRAEADIASVRKENDAKTLIERGKGFAAVGDHTRAEEYLASGIEAGADPRDVLPLLIDVCVKTGRYRSAIQHGENHLRKHPNDVGTRVMVGALHAAINEGKEARAQLEQVVGRLAVSDDDDAGAPPLRELPQTPDRLKAQAHYVLALVARDTDNDVVRADRHFREYLRLEPNGAHVEEAKAALLKRMP